MTTININVGDFGAQSQPGDAVILSAPAFREAHSGTTLVSTAPRRVELVDGSAIVESVEPGPLLVAFHCRNIRDSNPKQIIVPDSGTVTLSELMRSTFNYTPPIVGNVGEAAGEAAESAQAARQSAQAAQASAVEAKKSETVAAESKASAADSAETATAAAATATSQANTATQAARTATAAHDGVSEKIATWQTKSDQLDRWQPQYEWLRENAADGFAKQREIVDNAAASVRSEVTGLVEQAERASSTAGTHKLKAEAAAKNAETTTKRVVDKAINELKGSAPAAWDTIKELADELQSQKSVATALVSQVAEKAPQNEVAALKNTVNGLGIGGVRGLSQQIAELKQADTKTLTDAKAYADTRTPSTRSQSSGAMSASRYGNVVTLRFENATVNSRFQLSGSDFHPSRTTTLVTGSININAVLVTISTSGSVTFSEGGYGTFSGGCTYVI